MLNSLSLDLIAASFAALCDGGTFEDIGKRGIWTSQRHLACALQTTYCAIALDADVARDLAWMHGVLSLLTARGETGAVSGLPLRSFDMHMQHQLAFRTLQSGLSTGKVVVRVAAHRGAVCLLYTSPSPRDQRGARMPSSA